MGQKVRYTVRGGNACLVLKKVLVLPNSIGCVLYSMCVYSSVFLSEVWSGKGGGGGANLPTKE